MTTMRVLAAAALIVASAWAPHVALSQAPGTTRNDLQRHEVVQVLVGFAPEVVAPRHSHQATTSARPPSDRTEETGVTKLQHSAGAE